MGKIVWIILYQYFLVLKEINLEPTFLLNRWTYWIHYLMLRAMHSGTDFSTMYSIHTVLIRQQNHAVAEPHM